MDIQFENAAIMESAVIFQKPPNSQTQHLIPDMTEKANKH